MAFSRRKGSDRGFARRTISSLALAVGDVVAYDRANEIVIKATASSTIEELAGVVVEATTTADTSVLLQELVDGDEYIADTANNSSTAHNYHRMLLTDENTVNNTGTDDTTDAAVFMQIATVGAAGDKKILGRFVRVHDRAA